MTVSFHKYGDFFPGTGALGDVGTAGGAGYSVNVPLQEGMDDESYRFVFEPIMQKVMEVFQPGAIVVCGGADSLSGDRLGCFNLSLDGHAAAIDFLARFRVPMLVLGGGGYTMRNVARCWAYETGRLLGLDLPDDLPPGALDEYDYYVDTHRLRIAVSNMRNANTREGLAAITRTVLANLSRLPPVPSVPFTQPPPAMGGEGVPPEPDMDIRGGGAAAEDARVVKDGYGSDGGREGAGDGSRRPRTIMEEVVGAPAGAPAAVAVKAEEGGGGAVPAVAAEPAPAPAAPGTDEAYLAGAKVGVPADAGAGAGPGSEAAAAAAAAAMETEGGGGGEAADPAAPAAAADANGAAFEAPAAVALKEEEPDGGAAPMAT
jgi:histone deacetylase 1/2